MSVLTLRKRIIYDTHGANIYINICTTKIFIEKVKMTINYQEEIKFISNKIRELRKEKQMTVQELAYRCDMERSNMSRIESGRTNLTVKTMCIICKDTKTNLKFGPVSEKGRKRGSKGESLFYNVDKFSITLPSRVGRGIEKWIILSIHVKNSILWQRIKKWR